MFHVEHFEAWHFCCSKLLFFAVRFQICCDLSARSRHVAAVDIEYGHEVGAWSGTAQDADAFARAGAAVGDDGKDALVREVVAAHEALDRARQMDGGENCIKNILSEKCHFFHHIKRGKRWRKC